MLQQAADVIDPETETEIEEATVGVARTLRRPVRVRALVRVLLSTNRKRFSKQSKPPWSLVLLKRSAAGKNQAVGKGIRASVY